VRNTALTNTKAACEADEAIFTTIGKTPPLASFIMDITTPIGSSGRRLLVFASDRASAGLS
jgi:hypothetical protein